MTEEQRADLAALHALGLLEGEELRQAEALMRSDADFAREVSAYQDCAAELTPLIAPVEPSPQLKDRVLRAIAETPPIPAQPGATSASRYEEISSPPAARPRVGLLGWLGWTLAAGGLCSSALLYMGQKAVEGEKSILESRSADLVKELDLLRADLAQQTKATEEARVKAGKLAEESDTLAAELETLRAQATQLAQRNALSEFKITSLQAQVNDYQKAAAVVVWNQHDQKGIVQFTGLPAPEQGKDYQMWIVDPTKPNPVDGGVVTVDDSGVVQVPFQPQGEVKVDSAAAFALSVERKGGVPKAEGPIILLGK